MITECRHPVVRVLLLEDISAVPASVIDAGLSALSNSNWTVYHSLKSAERRRLFVLARYLLTEDVYRQLGTRITVERLASGQPWIREHPLCCSITHSGKCIAVAYSSESPIGIDLEQHRKRNFHRLVSNCFHPDEVRSFNRLGHNEQLTWFYRYWTTKEALAKVTGEGIGFAHLRKHVRDLSTSTSLSYRLDPDYSLTCAHRSQQAASLVRVFFPELAPEIGFSDLHWTNPDQDTAPGDSPTSPALQTI